MTADPRRHIPRTDKLLSLRKVQGAAISQAEKKALVAQAQDAARRGEIAPDEVEGYLYSLLPQRPSSLTPVVNATGIIVHTNIGRAPLSDSALEAIQDVAGYTDLELDLSTGRRSSDRGRATLEALLTAVPEAEAALVVNNGAAALLLATTALAEGGEVIISRGELIEIGAGFRLPELIESARVDLVEIGATNRTHLHDYQRALGENTKAILKVHPSNYLITGFSSSVSVAELQALPVPVIVDLGSGLLHPDPVLYNEPDISAQLRAGADVVIASGDKLLGGPQAGILLGKKSVIDKLKKHPLARALRIDKLRLAALEATVREGNPPVMRYLHIDQERYLERTKALAEDLQSHGLSAKVIEHAGRVGGGGAPEFPLPGYAVAVAEELAAKLRNEAKPILTRVVDGKCVIDLRCVDEELDILVRDTVRSGLQRLERP